MIRYMMEENKMPRRIIKQLLDYAACMCIILILVIMPFYNREGYSHIGTDKSFFFNSACYYIGWVVAPVTALLLIITVFSLKKDFLKYLRRTLSVTDLLAAGYGLVLTLSLFFSDFRTDALWGSAGWYMGYWPQMFFLMIYFLISRFWNPGKWAVHLGLLASFLVFLLGFLNRFNIDPLNMGTGLSGFISTIGNINWYCGYFTSIFFVGASLLWLGAWRKKYQFFLLVLYVLTGFATLVSQGSDSGIFTLVILMTTMFLLSARDGDRMRRFWLLMTLLGCSCMITCLVRRLQPADSYVFDTGFAKYITTPAACVLITVLSASVLALIAVSQKSKRYPSGLFRILPYCTAAALAGCLLLYAAAVVLNTRYHFSDNPFLTFNMKWGSGRGATWIAGIGCFREQNILHILFGTGPDTMSAYIYTKGSPELLEIVNTAFGSAVLTNAHNEWITVLVNTGILGLTAFFGMFYTGMYRFIRRIGRDPYVCSCGICLLANQVNNIFSFQQAMNTSTVFVIFGIGAAFIRASSDKSGA